MPSEKRRVSRRRVPLTSLVPAGSDEAEIRNLVDELASTGLIVKSAPLQPSADNGAEEQGGVSETWVEVAHEELLRNWPRLRGSIEVHAERLLLRQEVGDDARDWWNSGNSAATREAALLNHRGTKLRAALPLLRESHEKFPLNAMEAAYLSACEELERQERERERRRVENERRYTRNLRRALGAVGAMLCVAVITAGVALRERNRAQKQARISTSRQLAVQARVQMPQRLDTALLLSAAAWEHEPTQEAQGVLLDALTHARRMRAILHLPVPQSSRIVFHPKQNLLMTVGEDGAIYQWDTDQPAHPPKVFREDNSNITRATYSPDGQTILAIAYSRNSAAEGHALRFDTFTGKRLTAWKVPRYGAQFGDTDDFVDFVCSADSRQVAAVTREGRLFLWKKKIDADAYSLRTSHIKGLAVSWMADFLPLVVFSADGTHLLFLQSEDKYLRWNIRSGVTEPQRLGGSDLSRPFPVFSANGRACVFARDGGLVWRELQPDGRMASEKPLAAPVVTNQVGEKQRIALRPDGRQIVTLNIINGQVRLDSEEISGEIARLSFGTPPATDAIALSSDGKTLAISIKDTQIALYDITSKQNIIAGGGHPLFAALPTKFDIVHADFDTRGKPLFFCEKRGQDEELYVLEDAHKYPLPQLRYEIDIAGFEERGIVNATVAATSSLLAVSTKDNRLLMWDYKQDKLLGKSDISPGPSRPAQLSSDGRFVAYVDSKRKIVIGNARNLSVRTTLSLRASDPPFYDVGLVTFLPEGDQIAVTFDIGKIELYRTSDGKFVRELSVGRSVARIAFGSKGETFFTSHIDGTLFLRNGFNGQPIGDTLIQPNSGLGSVEPIFGLSFDAQRQQLLTRYGSGLVNLVDMNPNHWGKRAREIANRSLTDEEQQNFGVPESR